MNSKYLLAFLLFNLQVLTISIKAQEKQKVEIYVETGHSQGVLDVSFSPDGKIIASAGSDKNIKLWKTDDGKELATLFGHQSNVSSIAFSLDNKLLASGSSDNTVKIWDISSGFELKNFIGHTSNISSVKFSPDGSLLVSSSFDRSIKFWDIKTGNCVKTFLGHSNDVMSIAFSPNGKYLASASADKSIIIWDVESGKKIKTFAGYENWFYQVKFSPDGKILAAGSGDNSVKLWDLTNDKELPSLIGHTYTVFSIDFSPDGKTIASGSWEGSVKLWNWASAQELKTYNKNTIEIYTVVFSPNGEYLAISGIDKTIKFLDSNTWLETKLFKRDSIEINSLAMSPNKEIIAAGNSNGTIKLWNLANSIKFGTVLLGKGEVNSLSFSSDNRILAAGNWTGLIKLWNLSRNQEILTLQGHTNRVFFLAFSSDNSILASASWDGTMKLWNLSNGTELKTIKYFDENELSPNIQEFLSVAPTFSSKDIPDSRNTNLKPFLNDEYSIERNDYSQIILYKHNKNLFNVTAKITLIALGEDDWVVITPEGRFDTNKSLDNIEGIHWIVNDEILNPLPLDIFMRQYYEPGLLQRVLKCNEENSCDKEFKPLPLISEINRVQPKVLIKDVKASASAKDAVDVTVEIESVSEDVSVSSDDRTKKKRETSGVFDLRLFRDGQLVGVSTPKEKLEPFIKDAPNLIKRNEEYFKRTGKLTDTPEDEAWRLANDIFTVKNESVKRISPEKIEYTFRNVRLPKAGSEKVEFTAYAFNEDKVKSATTEPFEFDVPKSIDKKKGKAVVVSIGVNRSENPDFNLRYAANDARKMQEIVGGRLSAIKGEKYEDVVLIPLVSDFKSEKYEAINAAQKAIIKGVFALMAGESYEKVFAEIKKEYDSQVAVEFEKIPNIKNLKQIEPEDTLIISFSGHGVADRSGIFYLLPSDIGENAKGFTAENLPKAVSSDELSLWMQDITASEMIMIIDACHSSAAVQGNDFKPGPMGSRGLGQLAYDKDMKILSATQADNVALELGSLEQGLLSYALLQDGIVKSLADADKDKKLSPNEWLSYAERRVPEIYSEVKEGMRGILIDGKLKTGDSAKSGILYLDGAAPKSNLNLQQPSLFDFKRRKANKVLLALD